MAYVFIQLTVAGTDTGPFNLYSNADGYTSAFESNIPKSSLLSGITVEIPVGTVMVRVISNNPECSNYIDIPVSGSFTSTTSTTTVTSFLFRYGTLAVGGPMAPIPNIGDIDISSGVEITDQNTNNPINVPFGSDIDDFLWIAIPSNIPVKTSWYVGVTNQGDIGGPANQFGNLFSDPSLVMSGGIEYNLYISTARTNVITMLIS